MKINSVCLFVVLFLCYFPRIFSIIFNLKDLCNNNILFLVLLSLFRLSALSLEIQPPLKIIDPIHPTYYFIGINFRGYKLYTREFACSVPLAKVCTREIELS